ncbi:hypothetical protein MRX96_035694 [Rhipicephalus microplus]
MRTHPNDVQRKKSSSSLVYTIEDAAASAGDVSPPPSLPAPLTRHLRRTPSPARFRPPATTMPVKSSRPGCTAPTQPLVPRHLLYVQAATCCAVK